MSSKWVVMAKNMDLDCPKTLYSNEEAFVEFIVAEQNKVANQGIF